jgi:hypothetical protein
MNWQLQNAQNAERLSVKRIFDTGILILPLEKSSEMVKATIVTFAGQNSRTSTKQAGGCKSFWPELFSL